jgi:hypothetical protein
MRFREFIKANTGKCVDFDGKYAGQCVDLARAYFRDVLGIPQPRPVVGAADFYLGFESDPILNEHFEKIPNTTTTIPQYGDVIIWDKNAGKGFGHVAMFIWGDVKEFTSFDQNWPTLSKCTLTDHDYKHVVGYLRPKNQKTI